MCVIVLTTNNYPHLHCYKRKAVCCLSFHFSRRQTNESIDVNIYNNVAESHNLDLYGLAAGADPNWATFI